LKAKLKGPEIEERTTKGWITGFSKLVTSTSQEPVPSKPPQAELEERSEATAEDPF